MSEFKSIPTLEQLARQIAKVHQDVRSLAQAMGKDMLGLGKTLEESAAITDAVLQEQAMQITFIMQQISLAKPLHGGIADVTGKVPMEKKSLAQIYVESGRAKILEQVEARRRAQGVSTATEGTEGAPAGETAANANGEAHDTDSGQGSGPKLITH